MGLLRPRWPHSDAAVKGHLCSVPPSNKDITPFIPDAPPPTPTPSFPRTYGFLAKVIPPTLHPSFPRTHGFLAKVIPPTLHPSFPRTHGFLAKVIPRRCIPSPTLHPSIPDATQNKVYINFVCISIFVYICIYIYVYACCTYISMA